MIYDTCTSTRPYTHGTLIAQRLFESLCDPFDCNFCPIETAYGPAINGESRIEIEDVFFTASHDSNSDCPDCKP